MSEGADQGMPRPRGRKSVSWRHDPAILVRLAEVERRHLKRETNVAIAEALDVDEKTVRRDIGRLNELWLERTAAAQDEHRARVLAELEDVRVRALEAAEWDRECEEAVLFGDGRVYRDDKGSASFRGQKAQALAQARQATMDKAKILGIVVDKIAPTNAAGEDLPIDELMARFSRRQAEAMEQESAPPEGAT